MPRQPLAEVFGFPIDNQSGTAVRHRTETLCPFNNRVPECTKDKIADPLGVCSIHQGAGTAITCPVRFKEDWIIAEDAAAFFFPPGATYKRISEVRLDDADGKSAGNIDLVLARLDERGRIIDYGAVEIQAVYISGNVRNPFKHYMADPAGRQGFDWSGKPFYPNADYLSSSRKRLGPQLVYKGGILKTWGRKLAVALDQGFWNTLPKLTEVPGTKAEVAWMIYDLKKDERNVYKLQRQAVHYTTLGDSRIDLISSLPG